MGGCGWIAQVCSVPLQGAALCQDCSQIALPQGSACAVCGSRSLLMLEAVLNRTSGPITGLDMNLNCAEAQKGETHG